MNDTLENGRNQFISIEKTNQMGRFTNDDPKIFKKSNLFKLLKSLNSYYSGNKKIRMIDVVFPFYFTKSFLGFL